MVSDTKSLIRSKRGTLQKSESTPSKQAESQKFLSCKNQSSVSINDPQWQNQWYLNDACPQGYNLNVTKAWSQGFTGRGIVISIIDDGIEKDNKEIIDNYDPLASYDLNDDDFDPQPRYEETNENKHGTRCAGEIAARPNNSYCGTGVAFNSRIGGIRLLDGQVTDRLEAEALTYNIDYIDIFSASWGPLDNGKTVDGPGILSRKAFENGVTYGRNGKGTVYVWAAGNGGRFMDNCNCDGYTSSIFTITIGGITQEDEMPLYSERCSSTLASAYSSGNNYQNGIITTDLYGKCTSHHSGTSASAPIAAGIIALVLEANPSLTWRDIQYLIVKTANPYKIVAHDWKKNGVGKWFSHNYGFGLMNAGKMVDLAVNWKLVGPQLKFNAVFLHLNSKKVYEIGPYETEIFKMEITNNFELFLSEILLNRSKIQYCNVNIKHLEHMISVLTLRSDIRGKLRIRLKSPSGTESSLLEFRDLDDSNKGFKSWPFMSVHYWGENPYGSWFLEVTNNWHKPVFLDEWYLDLYGVAQGIDLA